LINALDLLESTSSASDKDAAKSIANAYITKEINYNTKAVGQLVTWLNKNKIAYTKDGDIITIK